MSKVCKFCGMQSDDDEKCTWCKKQIGGIPSALQKPPSGGPRPTAESARPAGPTAPATPRRRGRASAEADKKPMAMYYGIGAGALVLVLGIVIAIGYSQATSAPPAPGEFQSVEAYTKEFTVQVPANWKYSTAGSKSSFAQFVLKATPLAMVKMKGSGASGALGDVSAATSRMLEGTPTLAMSPEGKMHAMFGDIMKKEDPSFVDEQMQPAMLFGASAAASYYTAKKSFLGLPVKVKGWRVTSGTVGDYSYNFRAECPEKHWDEFEPAVKQIAASVAQGKGE